MADANAIRLSMDPRDPQNAGLWEQALKEVASEEVKATILHDLKALWLNNRERQKFNPLLREILEVIRKYDPQWDGEVFLEKAKLAKWAKKNLPKPTFDICMPGSDKPITT